MKNEIKPCPFCGYSSPEPTADHFTIHCCACGSTGPDFNTSDEAAIEKWNARSSLLPRGNSPTAAASIAMPTPRTDAQVIKETGGAIFHVEGVDGELVRANWARCMEYELDQLQQKFDALQASLKKQGEQPARGGLTT